ncbi:MAG: AraC family transcriptional regulator [Treponema sp.]|jgi:AraC-like DNA-binding protein|nr:AraC family transcriptional regulator [Treponema sp.]
MNEKGLDQNDKELMFSKDPFFCAFGRYAHRPYYYHPHWHDFMELLFIRRGSVRATLRNTEFTINKGELLVVMPGEIHSFANEGEGVFENFVIHIDSIFFHNAVFDTHELSKIYPYIFSSWAPQSFLCGAEEMKKNGILPVVANLYTEFRKQELGYTLSIRAGLLEIFVWLLRRWSIYFHPTSAAGNFAICVRIQPVLEVIKEQYYKNLTTKGMAEKIYMSVHHFCRLFKKLTGYSFHDYLRSVRVVEAIKLLLSRDDSLKQIACQVGYDDVNYFIRVFKKETGISPDKYRKKYLLNK